MLLSQLQFTTRWKKISLKAVSDSILNPALHDVRGRWSPAKLSKQKVRCDMNNKKKFLVALTGALAIAAATYAWPAPGPGHHGGRNPAPVHHASRPGGHHHGIHHRTPPPPPPPRHHHVHHTCGLGIAAGIVQTIVDIITPQPAVVAPTTVVTTPVAYQTW